MIWILLAIAVSGMAYLAYSIVVYQFARVPVMFTKPDRLVRLFEYIDAHVPLDANTTLVDLGCADGRLLFAAEKHGIARLYGYELSPIHAWNGKLRAWLTGSRVHIERANFFNQDISTADIIYVFLNGNVLRQLQEKIQREAKAGALIISLGQEIPDMQYSDTIELDVKHHIYMYCYRK